MLNSSKELFMLIIIDAKMPESAIEKLEKFGTIFKLESFGTVYPSISGHPDIFMFQMEDLVIIAPNSPKSLVDALKQHRITFLRGKEKLGNKFPETSYYNAVSTPVYLIHKQELSTSCILRHNANKKFISVNQAYTRCNLLALPDGSFITSDKGIEKALKQEGIEIHYFIPNDVILKGQDHGFLPGACGIFHDTVFLLGNLSHYSEGHRLKELLESKGLSIEELYQGPMIDGGGIFFLNS